VTVNAADCDAPPADAVIVTGVDVVTALVATEKLALVAPAATVTLDGTLAAALLLDSATDMPPAGAALVSVTVPEDDVPPVTLVGFTDTAEIEVDAGASGFTVSVADCVTPPPVTEIVTTVCVVTCVVKMLKPPAVAPDGIITLPGSCAIVGWLLVNWKIESVGCADAIVTLPNELPPVPTVDVGFNVSDAGLGCGVSVTVPGTLAPFHVAVSVAVVFAVTMLVGSENDVENDPGFTNTDAGGATAGLSLDSITLAPPAGACPVSITIAPAVAPPLIVLGEIVSVFSAVSLTVSCPEADAPFSVAVIVAGVAEAT